MNCTYTNKFIFFLRGPLAMPKMGMFRRGVLFGGGVLQYAPTFSKTFFTALTWGNPPSTRISII